jgi:hypothetical protein
MDIGIGVLTAFRRTAAFGLIAGIVASFGYMLGAAILTPDLWMEPLGALVKTGPAVVLMLVALATLDNRERAKWAPVRGKKTRQKSVKMNRNASVARRRRDPL